MAKNISGHFVEHLSSWRRMAAVAWSPPDDPTIYGTIDLDMTDALEFLREESERTGEHLTVTHLVTKAMADTLAEHPECNCIIRRGRIFERDDIDISVLVAVPPEEADREQEADLSGALVKNADRRSIAEIAREIREGARKVRKHEDPLLDRTKKLFDRVPPVVMGPLLRLVARLQYDFNLDLSAAGIPNDPFGSAIVTSVGVLGITEAFPPLLTFTRVPAVLAVGAVEDKPGVRDGELVVVPAMRIAATFDHRVIDGFQGGKLAKTFKSIIQDPAAHFGT
ncbi:MAG: 2-oxo acid dehydrogenase subunit E2 [Myxococcales bacterium]|jgi:pyruvate dehydrogenase E2 component (dihydrolipoamide acetyltransferase)|nr:2-oxo acid dehydrogenase subunit E2 [Myxococcales bacterium]MDH3842546.1 2-oxo acid dehydrogenase subunit E2 [Myxococcales bacterium]